MCCKPKNDVELVMFVHMTMREVIKWVNIIDDELVPVVYVVVLVT